MKARAGIGRPAVAALALCGAAGAAAIALGVVGESAAAVGLGVASVAALRLAVLFTRLHVIRRPEAHRGH
ncbi:hypothetical protein [Streptacidiphilus sp. MAP12-20]|uniref:hypothetical protein n=1 Tax=Streptacidiphilus sp. MAP12-20 TaxID=3156299 RepID=UPI00351319E7